MSFERSWHRSYAAGVPREIAFDRTTMPEVLTRTAQRFPDRTALIFMGKRIAYRELEALVNRFARALTEICLLYTSPSPRDGLLSRMPSSA